MGAWQTVIKNKEYFAKSNRIKRQKKSKMIQYQEQMNQKIRTEYNIKSRSPNKDPAKPSKQASLVYGERMFMSKYKSKPKFLQTLNSTLSPKKQIY